MPWWMRSARSRPKPSSRRRPRAKTGKRSHFAGAGAAAFTVGTTASAVLVAFAGCAVVAGIGFRRAADEAILHRLRRHRDRHRDIGPRQDVGDLVGGDQVGQPQFGRRQFVQFFPGRHAQRQRKQVARAAHVEGVFGQPADVALDDHQVLRGVGRGLRVVGAIAHPDLMHAHMGLLRHVAHLARQQQEYAHGFAIGFRRDAAVIALHAAGQDAGADGGQHAQCAEATAERDGVVHRAAAGIEHEGRAGEFPAAGKFVEIPGLSAVTTPTALTQPRQLGSQATQLNFIGSLRSSSVEPARAELPSVAVAPGSARQSAAAQNNAQPRRSCDFKSLKLDPSQALKSSSGKPPSQRQTNSYHSGVIKWYPGKYASSIATCCTATKRSCNVRTVWRKCLRVQVPCSGMTAIGAQMSARRL